MPHPTLADLTTFRVGGPVTDYVEAPTREEFIDAIRSADAAGTPLLVLGGGSNLLASDEGFPGRVVRDLRSDITTVEDRETGRVLVTATAGAVWDAFVVWTLDHGLSGLEALSGIPGTVGAAPVQNVGAYGHEAGETLVSVRVWDRAAAAETTLTTAALRLGYRDSVVKRSIHEGDAEHRMWGPTGRWVVLEATFALETSELSAPVLYRELARRLGVEQGERADARLVRDTVRELRASKGMVLDPEDHDTWSAGSFFTNPILSAEDAERLPEDAPRFPMPDGRVKSSAAWLIDHAGFTKGWAVDGARAEGASLSTKHVLALTNRGDATSVEVVELALAVRAGVEERYGVRLVPEPVALGITW
ncbi:UDP-N-acetylmuramate dehydrogenase [Actinomyces culturomici]|uniref:UDP-N-acetylmuramate dehydrogenase n=1 Tax=Actinomyces culturomici TaxID=1926276 RepID=UPI000E20A341|nr:UDP-N-acetylmuramate dehydrogenase [Actinomyces culturomici]